jgi:hypothetical protein
MSANPAAGGETAANVPIAVAAVTKASGDNR